MMLITYIIMYFAWYCCPYHQQISVHDVQVQPYKLFAYAISKKLWRIFKGWILSMYLFLYLSFKHLIFRINAEDILPTTHKLIHCSFCCFLYLGHILWNKFQKNVAPLFDRNIEKHYYFIRLQLLGSKPNYEPDQH